VATQPARSRRAAPLPPEQRRAAIVAATRPLLVSHGGQFTTRQVAEAAGIAEGTIFRIFDSKADLVHAVIEDLLDPTEMCDALAALTPRTLEEATTQMITVIKGSVERSSAIFTALSQQPGDDDRPPRGHKGPDHAIHQQRARQVQAAAARVLEPFADELELSVPETAALMRSVTFATTHPFLSDGADHDASTLAHLFLNGLARSKPC
jgi:AcrR family transcriptional regulator